MAFRCRIRYRPEIGKIAFHGSWHRRHFAHTAAAFNRWNDERNVNVNRNDNEWNDNWWFAGRRYCLHYAKMALMGHFRHV